MRSLWTLGEPMHIVFVERKIAQTFLRNLNDGASDGNMVGSARHRMEHSWAKADMLNADAFKMAEETFNR